MCVNAWQAVSSVSVKWRSELSSGYNRHTVAANWLTESKARVANTIQCCLLSFCLTRTRSPPSGFIEACKHTCCGWNNSTVKLHYNRTLQGFIIVHLIIKPHICTSIDNYRDLDYLKIKQIHSCPNAFFSFLTNTSLFVCGGNHWHFHWHLVAMQWALVSNVSVYNVLHIECCIITHLLCLWAVCSALSWTAKQFLSV